LNQKPMIYLLLFYQDFFQAVLRTPPQFTCPLFEKPFWKDLTREDLAVGRAGWGRPKACVLFNSAQAAVSRLDMYFCVWSHKNSSSIKKDRPLSNTLTSTCFNRHVANKNGASKSVKNAQKCHKWRLQRLWPFYERLSELAPGHALPRLLLCCTGRRVIKSKYIIVATATAWIHVFLILCTEGLSAGLLQMMGVYYYNFAHLPCQLQMICNWQGKCAK